VLDYSIWPWLSKEVYRLGVPANEDELIQMIDQAWQRLPQQFVQRAIDNIELRLRRIIENDGGPIEKFWR
jgi:hypothetical protein